MIQYGKLNQMLPVLESLLANTRGRKKEVHAIKKSLGLLKRAAL